MKAKKNENNVGKVIAIGAGVAALTAAGYFFLGPNGKKNRRVTRAWMIKMKGDIVEKMESMKDITEEAYHKVVDTVAAAYTTIGGKEEVSKMAKELKGHWKSISGKGKSKAKKVVKKAVKKAVKKIVRKK